MDDETAVNDSTAVDDGTAVNDEEDDATSTSDEATDETEASPEGKETVTEDVKKHTPSVPYERFKEVNDKMRDLEAKLLEIEKKEAKPEEPAPEPKTWDEVFSRAEQRVLAKLDAVEQQRQREEAEAQKYITDTVAELKASGKKFDENDFLKFALDLAESGMGDLKKAYTLYEKMQKSPSTEKAKERAKLASRTKTPVSEPGGPTRTYAQLRSKSLDDVVAEKILELEAEK